MKKIIWLVPIEKRDHALCVATTIDDELAILHRRNKELRAVLKLDERCLRRLEKFIEEKCEMMGGVSIIPDDCFLSQDEFMKHADVLTTPISDQQIT